MIGWDVSQCLHIFRQERVSTFFISPWKHMFWYSLQALWLGSFNEYPKYMLSWRNKKNIKMFWLKKCLFWSCVFLPPLGQGDILFLPRASVYHKIMSALQLETCSGYLQKLHVNINQQFSPCAECKNHNSCIFTLWIISLGTLSITKTCPLYNLKTSRYLHKTLYEYQSTLDEAQAPLLLHLYFLSYFPWNLIS